MLKLPREETALKIQERIDIGNEIRNRNIRTRADLDKAKANKKNWDDYNILMLRQLFDSRSFAEEYEDSHGPLVMVRHLSESAIVFVQWVDSKITALDSILLRLELLPESIGEQAIPTGVDVDPSFGEDIFIVHGSNVAAREAVARFIERLELRAIILHEQPSNGRTLIEKFEDHSTNAGFAVVILTPDDIGAPYDKPEEGKPRARQNVIFELGYFVAQLGRDRVCALYKKGVEIPSDYQGVVYIELDDGGGWKLLLAQEIKQAGIDFDMNKAV